MPDLDLTGIVDGETVNMSVTNGSSSDTLSLADGWAVTPPPPSGGGGDNVAVNIEGRMTLIVPPVDALNSITITTQPTNGNAVVRDDMTIVWDLTEYEMPARPVDPLPDLVIPDLIEYTYTTNAVPNTEVPVSYVCDAIIRTIQSGRWPSGETYYNELGSDLLSKIEPGLNHRKYHLSTAAGGGLTRQDIATAEGETLGTIDDAWLAANNVAGQSFRYGETEAYPLEYTVGMSLWYTDHPIQSSGTSDWLLLERGLSYTDLGRVFPKGIVGESPQHPIVVGAWGVGANPVVAKGSGDTVTADQQYTKYLVFRDWDLDFRFFMKGGGGDGSGGHFLIENVQVTGNVDFVVEQAQRTLVRFCRFAYQMDNPARGIVAAGVGTDMNWWNEAANRSSGIFVEEIVDGMVEHSQVLHSGWSPQAPNGDAGYNSFSDARGALANDSRPRDAKSHGFYFQKRAAGLIFKGSTAISCSAGGAQVRCGGILLDNFFTDNGQQCFTGQGQYLSSTRKNAGSYSYWHKNIGTQSGLGTTYEPVDANLFVDPDLIDKTPPIQTIAGQPNRNWKITTVNTIRPLAGQAPFHAFYDNIAAHSSDPADAANQSEALEIVTKTAYRSAKLSWAEFNPGDTPVFNNTRVYRCRTDEADNANLTGLTLSTLDNKTIHKYMDAHASGPFTATATKRRVTVYGDYLLTLTPVQYVAETKARQNFFLTGFGIEPIQSRTAGAMRFQPDHNTDGRHWLTPTNWVSADGLADDLQDGDSVNLAGNRTRCACLSLTLVDLDLAGGYLFIPNGYLSYSGTLLSGVGEIEIDYIGKFTATSYSDTDLLTITQTGGRFLNTGAFAGAADFNISDGQFSTDTGATTTVGANRTMTITGDTAKVGFDSITGGTSTLAFNADATLTLVGAPATIQEFHSGRGQDDVELITAPTTTSVVTLAGTLDMTGADTTASHVVVDVDTLSGDFGTYTGCTKLSLTGTTLTVSVP